MGAQREETYAEAIRRIREVENTETATLDLSALDSLNQLPGELERLTSLQTLNPSWCRQLSDLRPLADSFPCVSKAPGCHPLR
jgi:hypothetical protein